MDALDTSAFPPRTLDKVERLLDLMEEMGVHPDLRGKLAMHGGTAINLFLFGVPRLSVDVDVSYVGALDRDEMLLDRPAVERAIEEVGRAQGYSVSSGEGGHAGRSFVLGYRGDWGADHVKVDCIYMNRSPLLPLVSRRTSLRTGLEVVTFSDVELLGGKVKAFYDRVKVRDLYDMSNIAHWADERGAYDDDLLHKVMLWSASVSARFPRGLRGRSERFRKLEREMDEQLLPMLRTSENVPTLDALVEEASCLIETCVLPRGDSEREYLDRFAVAEYRPDLLFGEGEVAEAAAKSPEALWKLRNLKMMMTSDGIR